MNVIGIDPGPKESAVVEWDGKLILLAENIPNEQLLGRMEEWVGGWQHLWIEGMQSYGVVMGGATVQTLMWIGRFIQNWKHVSGNREVFLCYRPKIKAHICGNAAAKDSHVAEALQDRLGPKGTKAAPGPTFGISKHLWSALAVATYGYDLATTCQTPNTEIF